jgi:hypothetical protein
MRYVCDAPGGKVWFRIETEAEAFAESQAMGHAVEKHFRQAREKADQAYRPHSHVYIEQDIGRAEHVQRAMPLFLTLRDNEGTALATAMLPPEGREDPGFRPIIVGTANGDPYPAYADCIRALGERFGLKLDRARCYPYQRS